MGLHHRQTESIDIQQDIIRISIDINLISNKYILIHTHTTPDCQTGTATTYHVPQYSRIPVLVISLPMMGTLHYSRILTQKCFDY